MRQWPPHQGLHPFSVEEEEEDNDGEEDPFADVNELETRGRTITRNSTYDVIACFCFVFVERAC